MSYTIQFFARRVPRDDEEAWGVLEEFFLNESEGGKPPVKALTDLHQALTERYPCLSAYADEDPQIDDCPWSDGPLIDNFVGKVGSVSIQTSRAGELMPFILDQARALKVVVVDVQSGDIHRAAASRKPSNPKDAAAEHKKSTLSLLDVLRKIGWISFEEWEHWWIRINDNGEVVEGRISDRIEKERELPDYPLKRPFNPTA
jgi:hypothetical protein